MVPDIAKKGHSFKGAFEYYLHDKGAQTSERVGWTETRNLMTDDPMTARNIMIATAMQADDLKAAAGIKSSGRKSTAAVYAYALAWHPDETVTRDEMIAAADATLKELKADHLQSVIVCHTDQDHPHVHVILNRVDPADGRMHGFSNDRLKLSDWANRYERERGNIVTPKREEKRLAREQNPDAKSRQDYAQEKRDEAAKRDRSSMSEGAILKDLQDAQKADHRQAWKNLSATNKVRRNKIYDHHRARIQALVAEHKTLMRPVWRDHFKDDRRRRREFDKRERSIWGIVQNAVSATAAQHIKGELDGRGHLSAAFKNLLSSHARFTALDERLEAARQDVAARGKAILDEKIEAVKKERSADLAAQRSSFLADREDLIARQNGDRAKMKDAWTQLRARQASSQPRREPVKGDFDKTRQPKAKAAKAAPTQQRSVSAPSPAPAPSGEVPRSTAKAQQVPVKDWGKTSTSAQPKNSKPAKKDWEKTGANKAPTVPPKDWGKAADRKNVKPDFEKPAARTPSAPKDWGAKADKPREIRKHPPIKRDLDRSR